MTTEYNGPPRRCKDCYPEGHGVQSGWVPKKPRPAPHPGPRCVSHHREVVKARKAANHEKRVQETYGLQRGEYAQLYQFQGGRCAICRRATGASKKLAVDHDHQTGEVRGETCSTCNRMLGHARDRIDFFERAISYLKYPPYKAMKDGWKGWYGDD